MKRRTTRRGWDWELVGESAYLLTMVFLMWQGVWLWWRVHLLEQALRQPLQWTQVAGGHGRWLVSRPSVDGTWVPDAVVSHAALEWRDER